MTDGGSATTRGRRPAVRAGTFAVANVVGVAAFVWPFLLPALVGTGASAHGTDGPWILVVLLACLGGLLFVELSRGGLGPKVVALVGVLGAAMVALRLPGFVAGFSAMFIVVLLGGHALGPGFGFVLGTVGTFASGLFVGGIGPWLPFQMVAVGWMGAGAGVVSPRLSWPLRLGGLAAYAVVSSYLFGAVMNLWFWPFVAGSSSLGWRAEAGFAGNLSTYVRFYLVTSAPWDTFRAVGSAALVLVLGRSVLPALDRVAARLHVTIERPVQ